jgi:hypothetical protein
LHTHWDQNSAAWSEDNTSGDNANAHGPIHACLQQRKLQVLQSSGLRLERVTYCGAPGGISQQIQHVLADKLDEVDSETLQSNAKLGLIRRGILALLLILGVRALERTTKLGRRNEERNAAKQQ